MSKFMNALKGNKSSSKDTSIRDFVLGLILVIVGVYFVFRSTRVGIVGMYGFFRTGLPTGIATLPMLIGIAIVFFSHRSKIGWSIVAIGIIILLIQIILSVRIIFVTTGLLDYFLMFGGVFGGLGLLAKAFLR